MAEPQSQSARLGLALGLVGMVIFGLTLPMTRLAVLELDPVFVFVGRALIAAACSAIYLLAIRAPIPARVDWLRIAGVAACVVFLFPLLMAVAMRYAPSSHGGVVLGVLPLLTAMASVVVAGERPSLVFWLFGIAGTTAVVVYALWAGAGSSDIHWADLLLAIGAIAASTGYALSGELTRRMGGGAVISLALVISVPALLVFLAVMRPPVNTAASPAAWAAFAYVALFSQYIGFFAWNRGLALGGIAKVGQTQLLQTFVTLAGAAVFLGEPVGTLEIVFSLIVIAIVALGWRARVAR